MHKVFRNCCLAGFGLLFLFACSSEQQTPRIEIERTTYENVINHLTDAGFIVGGNERKYRFKQFPVLRPETLLGYIDAADSARDKGLTFYLKIAGANTGSEQQKSAFIQAWTRYDDTFGTDVSTALKLVKNTGNTALLGTVERIISELDKDGVADLLIDAQFAMRNTGSEGTPAAGYMFTKSKLDHWPTGIIATLENKLALDGVERRHRQIHHQIEAIVEQRTEYD